jgi:hypothetical protein
MPFRRLKRTFLCSAQELMDFSERLRMYVCELLDIAANGFVS